MASDRQREIAEDLFAKWLEWIDRIYNETITLFAYRSFYRGVGEMTHANDDIPPSAFFDALGSWYAITQAAGIRRQTDMDARAVSLMRLLTSMADNPTVMTRERYRGLYDDEPHWQERADAGYDSFAGTGVAVIPQGTYIVDRDRFIEAAQPIKDFVDRHVAHNHQRQLESPPTYGELNTAIDLLEELLKKDLLLLKATSLLTADPVHQADWRGAFRVPWLVD